MGTRQFAHQHLMSPANRAGIGTSRSGCFLIRLSWLLRARYPQPLCMRYGFVPARMPEHFNDRTESNPCQEITFRAPVTWPRHLQMRLENELHDRLQQARGLSVHDLAEALAADVSIY